MIDCQNVICISLGVFVIMVYHPPSISSEVNKHLSQFILNFSVDREVILIGYFNWSSINWGNANPYQGYFEPTTRMLIDAFISSGLSQWVAESMFFLFWQHLELFLIVCIVQSFITFHKN